MKKISIVLAAILMAGATMLCSFTTTEKSEPMVTSINSQRGVVFRYTQHLRTQDRNYELYFYSDGSCKFIDRTNNVRYSGTYSIEDKYNISIELEDGSSVYGSVSWKIDQQNASKISFSGRTYYSV